MTNLQHDYITSLLDHSRNLIGSLARTFGVDFDDLYQQAALSVCEILARDGGAIRSTAYMRAAIRYQIIQYVMRRPSVKHTLSLEYEAEGCPSLEDVVSEPTPVYQDIERQESRQAALYAALWQMPLEEQMYLRHVYELNAFLPRLLINRKPNYNRSKKALSCMALWRLRNDRELAAAIVEVC